VDHVQWEEVACPLCHENDAVEILHQPAGPNEGTETYRLVRCGQCGLGYLNPRPTPGTISYYYPADYQPYQPKEGEKKARRWSWSRILHRADPHSFLPVKPPGLLLDFGCGSGAYLQRMRELGWEVIGIDVSAHAVEATKQRGIGAYQGALPHPAVPPGSVDVVNFGAVLEHVHDPHQLMAAAKETVRPGGLVVFSVPNLASWGARVFGPAWWPLELPRHLLHFTPHTLSRLVKHHGLEIIEARMPPRTNWMRLSVAQAMRNVELQTRHSAFLRLMSFRPMASWVTRWTAWQGQGDCLLMITRRPANQKEMAAAA
jgi:2-polyprenyl-3-methyl-5-hydroxy-6-metoxy-1,4-benzoquinol methylase